MSVTHYQYFHMKLWYFKRFQPSFSGLYSFLRMDGAQTSLTIQFQNGVPGSTTNFGDSSKDQFYLGLTGLKNIDFGTKGKYNDHL